LIPKGENGMLRGGEAPQQRGIRSDPGGGDSSQAGEADQDDLNYLNLHGLDCSTRIDVVEVCADEEGSARTEYMEYASEVME